MALTGFDPSIVNTSINSVKSAYAELIQALQNDTQTKFVGGMKDNWACNEAQRFFRESFKPAIDDLIKGSDDVFESVVNSMNSAAQAWAERTESSYSTVSFSRSNGKVSVDEIQENIGGVRGVDEANANQVATSTLQQVVQASSSALDQAKSAVQSCGFIGGDQAANLSNALETIKSRINEAVNELSNQTKTAIGQTVTSYGDIRSKVENAFNA